MIPLPDDITADDIVQWIGRGVFLAKINGSLIPCVLGEDVSSQRVQVIPVIVDRGAPVLVRREEVFAAWPRCGAVNIYDTQRRCHYAAYVERQQRRQYTRTINARCLEVYVPERWALYKRQHHMPSVGQRSSVPNWLIAQLFDQSYPRLAEAAQLAQQRGSVAITNKLIVAYNNSDVPRLYYRRDNVGTFIDNTFEPELCSPATAARVRRLLEKVE